MTNPYDHLIPGHEIPPTDDSDREAEEAYYTEQYHDNLMMLLHDDADYF